MKRFISCIALVALASCVAAGKLSEDKQILHKRAGHFGTKPAFNKLYETYVAAFDAKMPKDDWENFRPSETNCYNYLETLVNNDFEIERLVDFVKYDACLGVLYQEEAYQYDNPETREELKNKVAFSAPWGGTKVEEMTSKAQHCIADLLLNAILGYNQFQNLNDHSIQLFVQFGKCTDTDITPNGYRDDPYLKMIYELVRKEAKLALKETVSEVKYWFEKMFDNKIFGKSKDKFINFITFADENDPRKVGITKEWPEEVYKLLSVFQNSDEGEALTIRSVHEKIKSFYDGEKYYEKKELDDPDEETMKNDLTKLLKVIGKKADVALVYRQNRRELIPKKGATAFNNWKDKLCKPFLYSDSEKKKARDFALKLQRLIDITAYEDLFSISEEYLLTKVLKVASKTSAIYLAVNICNILDYTEGKLNKNLPVKFKFFDWNKFQPLKYEVGLTTKRDSMIRWPILNYI